MSLLSKCLSLLLLYISTATAYPGLPSSIAFAEDIPFAFNYSNEDLKFGIELANLFSDLTKDEFNKKVVNKLIKTYSKSKSFVSIRPVLDRMLAITDIADQDSFYSNCEIRPKKITDISESIEDRMNYSIDKFCRSLFLSRMTQFSSNINFSTRDLSFFKEAVPYYINGESNSDLAELLKYYRNNTPEFTKLSNLIIDRLVDMKIRPSSTILTNIKVNSKLNQFLQNNINLDNTSTGYFQEEFQKVLRESQDAIEKGDSLLARQLSQGAIKFYYQNKNFISDRKAFLGIILAAKNFYYKGKDKEAIELIEQARNIASKEDYSESNFYLIWPYIVERDIKAMKKMIDRYSLNKEFDKFDSKLQYWLAFTESKAGDTKKAEELYNKLISNSPYSFYSIMALKELANNSKSKMTEDEIMAKIVNKANSIDFSTHQFNDLLKDSLRRLAIWDKIGNDRFQSLEMKNILNLSKENTFVKGANFENISNQVHKEFVTLNLIKLLNSKKRFIASFKVFQDSIDQNSLGLNLKLIKQLFPLNYFEIVKKNALNIDPLIILSLIRQESAFNPEANSGVGAKGLMQLMPATAKRFNKKVRVKHLANPEINVAIGTKYLRQLITRFDGNLIFALASYNAGENRIDRWRKEIFKSEEPLSIIEAIPFEETRNYVKLIYRNYFFYNVIHNKSILKTPVEESFRVTQKSF